MKLSQFTNRQKAFPSDAGWATNSRMNKLRPDCDLAVTWKAILFISRATFGLYIPRNQPECYSKQQRNDDCVVEMPDHWDEVWNDVEWQKCVTDGQR